jgi:PadR family transcriptional regulator, regulatory protein PadR
LSSLDKIRPVPGVERVTEPTLDVLDVLLQASGTGVEMYGWAIMRIVKRSGPTVYGVLDRLEDAGWVSGRWEERPRTEGSPRRRYYRLTPTGVTAARGLLAARRPQALRRPRRQAPGFAFVTGSGRSP